MADRLAELEDLNTDLKYSVREGVDATMQQLKLVLQFGITKELLLQASIGKTIGRLVKKHPDVRCCAVAAIVL